MPSRYAQVPTGARNAGLTASALRLYLYLDERAGQRGSWYDSMQTIATAIKCSKRTVIRATVELRRAGLIHTEEGPNQVLAFYVQHRQERLDRRQESHRVVTEMSPGGDTNVTGSAASPYIPHKEQPQSTTEGGLIDTPEKRQALFKRMTGATPRR